MNSKVKVQNTIVKSDIKKPKPPYDQLGFGKYFTDHMFVVDFEDNSWRNGRIIPYANLSIDPAACVLHYGQALFEGMKSFFQPSSEQYVLFRPEYNYQRMITGADRLCMQMPSYEHFLTGITDLIKIDQEWIPKSPGSSMYIRPTLIGTEAFLGVRPSQKYSFFVILSPVSSYYSSGPTEGVHIWVEDKYVRACPGGLGATKAAANYAGSLKAAYDAKNKGYAQVLWLDSSHQNVEEVGTMNVFFMIGNKVITPALNGSILPGGVRDCVLQLLRAWNIPCEERTLPFKEIIEAHKNGELREAFGAGTAAVISPIRMLATRDLEIKMPQPNFGPIAEKLNNFVTKVQRGEEKDIFNWCHKI